MNGYHQIENASVALAFYEIAKQNNFSLDFKINNAVAETMAR